MDLSTVLHFLAGPAIGGVIGYCTNYVAIKMLFRPREAIMVGGHALPFTPGIIPKRKDRLAREIGETVADKMFTPDDVEQIFLSEGMKDAVVDAVLDTVFSKEGGICLSDFMQEVMDAEEWDKVQKKLDYFLEKKAYQTVKKADMADRISYESRKILTEISRENNLVRVLGGSRLEAIADYMGVHLMRYAREHTDTLIMPLLRDEAANLMTAPFTQVMEEMQTDEESLRAMIGTAYERFMKKYKNEIVNLFDIASLTEQRIIELQVEEIEQLVNRTIHREMQSVINLGAVLGIIIGLVNSFL